MKTFTCIFILIFVCSCANHFGTISNTVSNKNVVYEDIAIGVSQSNKCFGLGGLSQEALVLEAKLNLMNSRPLKQNEEYLNFTVDFKKSRIFFFTQNKVTISADVISFSNSNVKDPFSIKYKSILASKNKIDDDFNIGDSVKNDENLVGKIISLERKNKVRVIYHNSNGYLISKKYSLKNLYNSNTSKSGLQIKDTIHFKNNMPEESVFGVGVVQGFNKKKILIKDQYRNLKTLEYDEILPKDTLIKINH